MVFLLLFQLRIFPSLFILLNFLCLCELCETITYFSLEGVLIWKHFYTDCVCSVPLVAELDLSCMQVMSFLRVCWQLSPW